MTGAIFVHVNNESIYQTHPMKQIEVSWIKEKSQNCVKAAIAFVCNNCKWQLLYALLQLTTFVCIFATAE